MGEYTIENMELKLSVGGPCIYGRGVFPDGKETGRIQWTSQTKDELKAECLASMKSGRDDVRSFVDSVVGRR